MKGIGILPYNVLFHNIPHFIKAFNLYDKYLTYVISSKSQLFDIKIQLFRELRLPVRTVNVVDA